MVVAKIDMKIDGEDKKHVAGPWDQPYKSPIFEPVSEETLDADVI